MEKMTLKKAMSDSRWCNVNTDGNKKLKNTDAVKFIIWNLPAVITCPFATESCKRFCYARKAEKAYPACLPSRMRNFEKAKSDSFASDMIFTLETLLKTKKFSGKKVIVRIHESGDFFSKKYAMAWIEIAKYFANTDYDITFMAYTKSILFFLGEDVPSCMVVRASIWNDTKPELKKKSFECFPIYTAFASEKMPEALGRGYSKCDCADCANCGKCWNNAEKKIACAIH